MQYALLLHEDEKQYDPNRGDAGQQMFARHVAFQEDAAAAMKGGAGLKPTSTATTVRTTAGRQSIHDGPFAEAKEQLGGFYLIEAPDLDAAIAIAKKVPLVKDGAIEIRPLLVMG
jgi:hypothetical protein